MESIQLTREVEAIQIPGGHPVTLEKGWDVVLTQSLGGQFLGVKWTDVIIFSILISVMVFRPNGLLGAHTPQKA